MMKNKSFKLIFCCRSFTFLKYEISDQTTITSKIVKIGFEKKAYEIVFIYKLTKWAQYNIYKFGTNTEIGQGLGRILSCGARKPEQT